MNGLGLMKALTRHLTGIKKKNQKIYAVFKVMNTENQKNSPHSRTLPTEKITLPLPLDSQKDCGNKHIWQAKQTR
jgi:hypothetical protein